MRAVQRYCCRSWCGVSQLRTQIRDRSHTGTFLRGQCCAALRACPALLQRLGAGPARQRRRPRRPIPRGACGSARGLRFAAVVRRWRWRNHVHCVPCRFDWTGEGQAAGHYGTDCDHERRRGGGDPGAVTPPVPHGHDTTVSRAGDIRPPRRAHSIWRLSAGLLPIDYTGQISAGGRGCA